MKNNQKFCRGKKNNNYKQAKNNEADKWKLSMKEVLEGACLINGDGSLVQSRLNRK